MIKYVFAFTLLLSVYTSFAHYRIAITDTTGPGLLIQPDKKIPVDSNVLVVINGKQVGMIREIKNLDKILSVNNIESINIIKGDQAFSKYGDKGKSGVIEILLKDEKLKDITPAETNDKGSNSVVFEKVEVEASFAGGDNAWRKYLEKNLNAMVPVENNAPAGRYTIIVQFIVDKEGQISNVKALTNYGYGMEQEVARVITKGPQWQPAVQMGKVVKAYRKQPVIFQIDAEGFDISTYRLKAGKNTVVEIAVTKVKDEDLDVSISGGTIIKQGDGTYIAYVKNAGKAILSIYNKKKNKEVGKAMMQVD